MARTPALIDQWGRPLNRAVLTEEIAAPSLTGVRSPLGGYPANGMHPERLAAILREADQGDPVRYLELAEAIEERDPHYLGVLATRRRSVAQIEITVEAASDAAEDVARADMVRDWVARGELADEIFDILDCIGKAYSFTEIIWDSSEGQWQPQRLEWRDPRWFRFDRRDLATPMLLGDNGEYLPFPAFKFIYARIRAKSGLPLRGGLARVASWSWMFKAFTQRDWAMFVQTYGQPLRVGKWGAGASKEDRATLFRAVANIAGDCAAIIPDSMSIDFVEAKSSATSSDLYKSRADWLDQQVSKLVLGQTGTTDAIAGGHAVGQEHRQVQEDIERSDAIALAAILNRDLVQPWMQLEFGPLPAYPVIKIARAEQQDIQALAQALGALVPVGLRVSASAVRDRLGFADPQEGEEVLGVPPAAQSGAPNAPGSPPAGGATDPAAGTSKIKRDPGEIKRGAASAGMETALQQEGAPAAVSEAPAPPEKIAAQLEQTAQPAVADMLATIEAMLAAAGSLDEFRTMLLAAFPKVDSRTFAIALAQGMIAAQAAGRIAVEEEAGG